jgi:hypothetical protein
MARARAWTHQRDPSIARLQAEARANVDDLERRVEALEKRVVVLERVAGYVRDELYAWLGQLAAVVPFAAPPEPPDR